MRIAELSRRTGTPVPTIKYYLREGLVPPGELTRPNQAQYDDRHIHRIRLIRALVEVGGLSISATRDVLASIDAPQSNMHNTLGMAMRAMTKPQNHAAETEAWRAASNDVADLISRRGWHHGPDSPAVRTATAVAATLRELGQADLLELLDVYADAIEPIAAAEVEQISRRQHVDAMVEGAVIGTVLGEAMIAALRLLAHEDASARRFARIPTGRASQTPDAPR